jgi:quercetin dioxygenase-like cupin family protein
LGTISLRESSVKRARRCFSELGRLESEGALNDCIKKVDSVAMSSRTLHERYSQSLLGPAEGAHNCTVSYVRTEPGGGSPEGLHTHDIDQIFFVLSGTMELEIDGVAYTVAENTAVLFPARVPHRNWNPGPDPSVHLVFCTPVPDPEKPFATRVGVVDHTQSRFDL